MFGRDDEQVDHDIDHDEMVVQLIFEDDDELVELDLIEIDDLELVECDEDDDEHVHLEQDIDVVDDEIDDEIHLIDMYDARQRHVDHDEVVDDEIDILVDDEHEQLD